MKVRFPSPRTQVQRPSRLQLLGLLVVLGLLVILLRPGSLTDFGFVLGLSGLVVGGGAWAARSTSPVRYGPTYAGIGMWTTATGEVSAGSVDTAGCDVGVGGGDCA